MGETVIQAAKSFKVDYCGFPKAMKKLLCKIFGHNKVMVEKSDKKCWAISYEFYHCKRCGINLGMETRFHDNSYEPTHTHKICHTPSPSILCEGHLQHHEHYP